MTTTRKEFIKLTTLMGAAACIKPSALLATASGFELPKLNYAYDALEPYIDAQTMQIHHTKHHQAYLTKLNELVSAQPILQEKSSEQLLTGWDTYGLTDSGISILRNHGGGYWNHSFFWKLLRKGTVPSSKLTDAITRDFGSLENMKAGIEKAAMAQFGSGWAWLVSQKGKLLITATPNQDNPIMSVAPVKGIPILGIDVWEHAYYLKYQNKRADYLKAFWEVCNWDELLKNYLTSL